eukprot:16452352-Heterocapsa_arctica.AAC.1
MYFPDHLHMIYGMFEDTVTESKEWEEVQGHYRSLAAFLGNRDARGHFMETCLQGKAEHSWFKNWSVGNCFDWKWQYLQRFLQGLLPLLPALFMYFNPEQLLTPGGKVGMETTLVQNTVAALAFKQLLGYTHVLLLIGLQLEREASWMEGCVCHQAVWDQTLGSGSAKQSAYRKASKGCKWKGKRAVEMAIGRVEGICSRILLASSPAYRAHLAQTSPDDRSALMHMEQLAKSKLVSRIRGKLAFWTQLPYSLLGALAHEQGHASLSQAKAYAASALAERDAAVAAGRGASLHRVAVRLTMDDNLEFKQQFLEFASDPISPLGDATKWELKKYAMGLIVTRRTEAQHALLKSYKKKKTVADPVLLNTLVKKVELLEQLNDGCFF